MLLDSSRQSVRIIHCLVVVLIFMVVGTYSLWKSVPLQPGIDFYQYWGIAKAQRLSGFELGSPYFNRDNYQGALAYMAFTSGDERLAAAVAVRDLPDPTGTPLSYYLLGMLPDHYSFALACFRVTQFAAFLCSVFLLTRPLKLDPITALALIAAIIAAYSPLAFDIGLGNVNCLQLLGFVATAGLAKNALRDQAATHLLPILLLTSLISLQLLFKPNFAPASLLLLGCLLLHARDRLMLVLAFFGAISAILFGLPGMLFGSWSIWEDWARFISSPGQVLSFSFGNYSGVRLIESIFGVGSGMAEGLVILLVALPLLRPSLSIVATWIRLRQLLVAILRALKEPDFALSAGIVLTFAVSPLIWQHYQLLALVPAFWLFAQKSPRRIFASVIGGISILLFADLPANINSVFGGVPSWLIAMNHGFSWFPLWLGMVVVIESQASFLRSAYMSGE